MRIKKHSHEGGKKNIKKTRRSGRKIWSREEKGESGRVGCDGLLFFFFSPSLDQQG